MFYIQYDLQYLTYFLKSQSQFRQTWINALQFLLSSLIFQFCITFSEIFSIKIFKCFEFLRQTISLKTSSVKAFFEVWKLRDLKRQRTRTKVQNGKIMVRQLVTNQIPNKHKMNNNKICLILFLFNTFFIWLVQVPNP